MTNQRESHTQGSDTYQAYLIRLWQDGEQAAWRASAQSVQSGETVRFADLVRLFAFLESQTVSTPAPGDLETGGNVAHVEV